VDDGRRSGIGRAMAREFTSSRKQSACRMKNLVLLVSVLLLWLGLRCYAGQLQGSVIVIIRHAEKPDVGDGLAPAGEARAKAYVDYFEHFTVHSNEIRFDYLFATKDSHESKRPRLTIKPLSKALGLDINTDFKDDAYAELADELQSGRYNNKNILVCWHHGKIPKLLTALGADPEKLVPDGKWPEDVFDWLVRLQYDQNGNLRAKVKDENLMPGDATNPPPQPRE
jgi:hypothetical protein